MTSTHSNRQSARLAGGSRMELLELNPATGLVRVRLTEIRRPAATAGERSRPEPRRVELLLRLDPALVPAVQQAFAMAERKSWQYGSAAPDAYRLGSIVQQQATTVKEP